MKKSLLLLGLLSLALVPVAGAAPFVLNSLFRTHMKNGTNPDAIDATKQIYAPANFGKRADGKYYPYSTPAGRRIGFGLPVALTADYSSGITPAEAESRLTTAINHAVTLLVAAFPTGSARVFNDLDIDRQEMLVDMTVTNGIAGLPTEFVDTLFNYPTTWQTELAKNDNCSYVRNYGLPVAGQPEKGQIIDILKNRAFAYRFMGTTHH